jgi:SSS family solute:Na+ symporter
MAIHWIDMAIIVAYLGGITGVGLWFSRHQRDSSAGYFLAGRSLGWVTVGLALFATNISTVHLTGLAGAGFSQGMVVGNFEWLAPFLLILLGLVFAPFYFRTRIATLPEYLEGRYSPASRTVLAFMAVVGALFIHIGVTLYAGAEVMKTLIDVDTPDWWMPLAPHLDFNIAVSIGIVSLLTIVYTALGGLKAVVVTESVQTVLLLLGAAAVTVFGLVELSNRGATSLADLHSMVLEQEARDAAEPGYVDASGEAATAQRDDHDQAYLEGEARSGTPRSPRLSMIRTTGDYTWWIMLLGYPVLGIWYWCADQTIVQRVLGARSEWDAQVGPIFAGFIKVLPVFLMVFPGVIAYLLFRDTIGDNADATLSVLILELLPRGMQGLVLAGLLAAMMSTVAGALNSTATLVSIDIVKRVRPTTADRTLVRIGQVTAVVVMIVAVAWSTQGHRFGGIFAGINQMISILAPPISTVFVWGIFWRRGTSAAALTTLLGGFALGAVVFVIDFPAFGIELITRQWGIPFMLQAWILFVICSVVYVVVSVLTPPPAPECVDRYCWTSPLAVLTGRRISGITDPRVLALLLVLVMVGCYWVFA